MRKLVALAHFSGILFENWPSETECNVRISFVTWGPMYFFLLYWRFNLLWAAGICDIQWKADGLGRRGRGRSTGSSSRSSSRRKASGRTQEPEGDPRTAVSPSREPGPGCCHQPSPLSGPEHLCCHSNTAALIHDLDCKFKKKTLVSQI